MIPKDVRTRYDYDLIKQLYIEYNHTKVDDTNTLQEQYSARLEINDDSTMVKLTNDEVEEEFEIFIYGDYNEDKVLNQEDSKIIVDYILDKELVDEDNKPFFNILDATNSAY